MWFVDIFRLLNKYIMNTLSGLVYECNQNYIYVHTYIYVSYYLHESAQATVTIRICMSVRNPSAFEEVTYAVNIESDW